MRWIKHLLVATIVFTMAGWALSCGTEDDDGDTDTGVDVVTPTDTAGGEDNPVTPDIAADTAPAEVMADTVMDVPSDLPADTSITDAVSTDVTVPGGCCAGDEDCPDGVCVDMRPDYLFGVCGETPGDDRCWTDGDCGEGNTCYGAALCPCEMDCDMGYVGTGFCAATGASCTAVDPESIAETCDAKSLWVFDGAACVETCAGCCGCDPWCQFTWDDEASCLAACATAPLAISLDSQGGFLGTGSFDYVIIGHTFKVTDPFSAYTSVTATLDSSTMSTLYNAVEAVDWSAIPEDLMPPDNPYCCCDQYSYEMRVDAPMIMPGTTGGAIKWCDESVWTGLLPSELLQLVRTIADIGGEILSAL